MQIADQIDIVSAALACSMSHLLDTVNATLIKMPTYHSVLGLCDKRVARYFLFTSVIGQSYLAVLELISIKVEITKTSSKAPKRG